MTASFVAAVSLAARACGVLGSTRFFFFQLASSTTFASSSVDVFCQLGAGTRALLFSLFFAAAESRDHGRPSASECGARSVFIDDAAAVAVAAKGD